MSTMSLQLPESLHDNVQELADREGISMNQIVPTAVTEKISALLTEEYLEERAKRGSREKSEPVLETVADSEPEPGDEPWSSQPPDPGGFRMLSFPGRPSIFQ